MVTESNKHSRTNSVSSLASFVSEDVDLGFDDSYVAPTPIGKDSAPMRQRLGAEMAIIASTSPEIKALNLPDTPTFPDSFSYSSRSYSDSSTQSWHGPVSRKTARQDLSQLLASMDDVEMSSSLPRSLSDHPRVHLDPNETDDLVRSFQFQTLNSTSKVGISSIDYEEDKENVHPNMMTSRSSKHKKAESRHFPVNKKAASRIPRPRKGLHRRASCQALPSPEEIGPSHKGRLVRRATTGSTVSPVEDDVAEEPTSCRRNLLPSMRMAPKSLRLSTGFR